VLEAGHWSRKPYAIGEPPAPESEAPAASRAEAPPKAWAREAENLVGLVLAYAMRHVLARVLSGITFAMVGLVLVLAAHLLYTFQGRMFWLTLDWVLIGAATAAVVWLLVKLEKDTILSWLGATAPGRLSWNGGMILRILAYGAVPVITMFATFFPEVGTSLADWIEPMKKVLP